MKRAIPVGIAVGAAVIGIGLIVTQPTSPSLPDVEVPAIQLSNADGMDPTAVWLDLFTQASGSNPESLDVNSLDSGASTAPGQNPLIVIEPQDSARDFEGLLDGIVGDKRSPLDAVNSAINGPDAVNYLILNGDS